MSRLVGTRHLVRLILRRDRFLLPLWIALFLVLPPIVVNAYEELYPTADARDQFYRGPAQSPALVALLGPVFGPSLGALAAQRLGIPYVVLGLITLLGVIRHTRVEEETGRRELLGSTVVGHDAPLAAALIVAAAASILIGVVNMTALLVMGLPLAGAVAWGAAFVAVGLVFAAVGGVASQLTSSAGGARGLGAVALGTSFLLRAVGDTGGPTLAWLSWFSPIGWAQQLRPFAGERWWVLLFVGAGCMGLAVLAFRLNAKRDLGAGILASRPGPGSAAPGLATARGLAFRLHRTLLIGWTLGLGVFGLVIGSAATAAEEALAASDQRELIAAFGGGSLAESFIIAEFGFAAVLVAGYATQATLRLRREESEQRADPVLATAVNRASWMGSHLMFAALGPVFALALAGVAAGLSYGVSIGDVQGSVVRLFVAAMVQLPAVWLMGAIAAALFGLAPRLCGASWGVLGFFLLTGQFGVLFGFPDWILNLSPFSHTPRIPGEDVSPLPLLVMLVIAAGLTYAGVIAFRRRDVGLG